MDKKYYFNIHHAKQFGLPEAVMIQNLSFWIAKNKSEGKNYHQGKYWTYNTLNDFAELFIFWTPKQIQRILNSLAKQNVILKSRFNKHKTNRTGWYAFVDESLFIGLEQGELTELEVKSPNGEINPLDENGNRIIQNGKIDKPGSVNPSSQTGSPLTDIITDRKQIKNSNSSSRRQSTQSKSSLPKKGGLIIRECANKKCLHLLCIKSTDLNESLLKNFVVVCKNCGERNKITY